MYKHQITKPSIKLCEAKSNPNSANNIINLNAKNNKISQLQLELSQAYSTIAVLKQTNKSLLEKLNYYERKSQSFKMLQQELEFRKEQQKNMQKHLDNYQIVNNKLRNRVNELQYLGCEASNKVKISNFSTHQKSQSEMSIDEQKSRKNQRKLILQNSSLQLTRKSLRQNSKQNHQITPKSRVSIDFQKFSKVQADCMLKIKERRKVFL